MISTNLGYPKIGIQRELKRTLEGYWHGKRAKEDLITTDKSIRKQNWKIQQSAGIYHIPSNDFSYYDHVLDTAALVRTVPSRYHWDGEAVDLDTYFSMACQQLALAIRDEVNDLEETGIRIIQIDEPALCEGLPLRHDVREDYLDWAIKCFRLPSSEVQDSTQIHIHMYYTKFNDIIDAIADMIGDIISIESSRSRMELPDAFVDFHYPNEIGPGVYDIYSPRIIGSGEVETLLRKALDVLSPGQLWVNPDCGLKTRRRDEIGPSLKHVVDAARTGRTEFKKDPDS